MRYMMKHHSVTYDTVLRGNRVNLDISYFVGGCLRIPQNLQMIKNQYGSNKTKVAQNISVIKLVFSRVSIKKKCFAEDLCVNPNDYTPCQQSVSASKCTVGQDMILHDDTSFCDLCYRFTRHKLFGSP